MKLPDTNVLVYAADATSRWHAASVEVLLTAGRSPRGLGLAWLALVGFVRLTTRRGPMAHPLSIDAALGLVQTWLAAPGGVVLQPGPRHFDLMRSLLLHTGTAGNLSNDAHLAAIAIEHGATLVSNDRDFDRFPGLSFQRLD